VEKEPGADHKHSGQTKSKKHRKKRAIIGKVEEMQEWADKNS
jgi:hypothetical protein